MSLKVIGCMPIILCVGIFLKLFLAEHWLYCGAACKEQNLTDCEGTISQKFYAVSKAQGSDKHTEGAISA